VNFALQNSEQSKFENWKSIVFYYRFSIFLVFVVILGFSKTCLQMERTPVGEKSSIAIWIYIDYT
jgi:hypothetical protein